MYKIIEIGDGITVSGDTGQFVLLDIPHDVLFAQEYEKEVKLLYWVNALARVGLIFHGPCFGGNAMFRIE